MLDAASLIKLACEFFLSYYTLPISEHHDNSIEQVQLSPPLLDILKQLREWIDGGRERDVLSFLFHHRSLYPDAYTEMVKRMVGETRVHMY
jgi:hypothetical protein